ISERKNRHASLTEICEATQVEEKVITRFIKEGRLHLADFPNLGYPCESCGTTIREGRVCMSCAKKLRSGLEQQEREEEILQRRKQKENRTYSYYAGGSKHSNRNDDNM